MPGQNSWTEAIINSKPKLDGYIDLDMVGDVNSRKSVYRYMTTYIREQCHNSLSSRNVLLYLL